jgi:hypothetical protein
MVALLVGQMVEMMEMILADDSVVRKDNQMDGK